MQGIFCPVDLDYNHHYGHDMHSLHVVSLLKAKVLISEQVRIIIR